MDFNIRAFSILVGAMVMSVIVNAEQAQPPLTEEFVYTTLYATKEPNQRSWLSRIRFKDGKIYNAETDTVRIYSCQRNGTKLELKTGINDLNISIDLAAITERVQDASNPKVRFASRATMFNREVYVVAVDAVPEKLTMFYIEPVGGILGFGSVQLATGKSDYVSTMYWLEGNVGLCHLDGGDGGAH